MSEIKVLVVDDEVDLLELLVQRLIRKGFEARGATSAEEALVLLEEELFDVGIFDIRMEAMDGLELLAESKKLQSDIEVIMLTGHGTIDTAIEAMKLGAYDYLSKPYKLTELEMILLKAVEKKSLKEENEKMKRLISKDDQGVKIIGESHQIKAVIELTKQVANSDIPILIQGETGTGKELFAKALHEWSERKSAPFVAINSGALSEQLLESELFGHVKGAFTGAQKEKKGLVEVANGGTLFLDELGDMPLPLQIKLLRFLESGELRRVGDVKLRKVNVRVVAATNRDMEKEVKEERFREDLYYRLHVVKLVVPPLRDRKEDLSALINYFLKQKKQWQGKELSKEAFESLKKYDFPGNVRELFHILERGFLLSKEKIVKPIDLMLPISIVEQTSEVGTKTLAEIEKLHLKATLEETGWNKTVTAELLGVSVRNIYRKIEQYQLENKNLEQ
ncbi:sigma-54 dependent transcriptional regulator [Bacillaceae bacterium IKA-2]|nr:sigma-54 dependent transcriptional regulator [Bacillaceae bacterium IKA-2]